MKPSLEQRIAIAPNCTVNEFIAAVVRHSHPFAVDRAVRERWLKMIADTQPNRERKIIEMTAALASIDIIIVTPGITPDV